jgi:hypothetical protein
MFLRLLSLGKTFYLAFDEAVDACKKLCRAELGLGVRMLVRTSDQVSDFKMFAIVFWSFFLKKICMCVAIQGLLKRAGGHMANVLEPVPSSVA